jgi:hypothetical protein
VKPGWTTSEFWLNLLAILLTYLFSTGTIPTSGPVAQVAAIAATLLTALGYTVARTSVKNNAIPGARVVRSAATVGLGFLMALSIGSIALSQSGCATATAIGACTVSTLEGSGSGGQPVLNQVEADLLSAQYLAALESTAIAVGDAVVNCALTAIRDLTAAELANLLGSGSGSGSAASPAIAHDLTTAQLLHDRAVAALKARGK